MARTRTSSWDVVTAESKASFKAKEFATTVACTRCGKDVHADIHTPGQETLKRDRTAPKSAPEGVHHARLPRRAAQAAAVHWQDLPQPVLHAPAEEE